MLPNAQEVTAYREFERSGRPIDEMTDEDKFLFQITKCERLEQKLRVSLALSLSLHCMLSGFSPVIDGYSTCALWLTRSGISHYLYRYSLPRADYTLHGYAEPEHRAVCSATKSNAHRHANRGGASAAPVAWNSVCTGVHPCLRQLFEQLHANDDFGPCLRFQAPNAR